MGYFKFFGGRTGRFLMLGNVLYVMQPIAKILVIAGVLLVIAGLLVWLAGDKLNWFGNLPGDIRITGRNMRFYSPFTSMLLLSLLFSLLLWLIRKFF